MTGNRRGQRPQRPSPLPSSIRYPRKTATFYQLRDLCFGDDLTYFFVAEWRAEDVHADVGGDSPQLSYVSGKKAPPLNILEEAFETAGGERRGEADTLGTIGTPSVRTELRQKNQITRCKNKGKIRRPNDRLALDQFNNLILPVMKMSRRPEYHQGYGGPGGEYGRGKYRREFERREYPRREFEGREYRREFEGRQRPRREFGGGEYPRQEYRRGEYGERGGYGEDSD